MSAVINGNIAFPRRRQKHGGQRNDGLTMVGLGVAGGQTRLSTAESTPTYRAGNRGVDVGVAV